MSRQKTTTPSVGSRVPRDRPRRLVPSGIDWIGDMPEGWKTLRVKYLATEGGTLFMDGDWINSDIIVDDGIRYLTSGNVGLGKFKRQGDGYITDETFRDLHCLKALPGDLMISRLNEPLGRACIIPDDEPFYVIAVDNVILRHDACHDKKYLMYCMSSDQYATSALMIASGSTMQRISRTDLGRLVMPIPPLPEQQAIAAHLDAVCGRIDSLTAKIEKEIAAMEEYRKSLITKCVTKGLDPKAKLKPSGVDWIGKIPEGWKVDKLCYAVSFGKGLNITKDDLVDEGAQVVSYGQIHSKKNDGVHLGSELLRHIPQQFCRATSKLKRGDFVFADTSEDVEGIGNCVHVDRDDEIFAGYHSLIVRPNEARSSHYLSYLFRCDEWRRQLRAKATGIKVFTISQRLFKGVTVTIPPLPEQREIAAYLDKKCAAIDAVLAKRRKQLEGLAEYRKSVIYAYVTGKKEVAA